VSKERVIVLSVVQQQLSKAETARRYQVSWRWVHTLVTRYQSGGWEAVEARSRRPHSNSRAVTAELRERLCTLRCELQTAGLDHGPASIAARLQQEGVRPPALSTIRRILTSAGMISPEPKKRPKSSYLRFQADQPNECWQSDFTHWQLADGTGVEIINWLDDHSRYLLASRAYRRVTGQVVITTFLAAAEAFGLPQSTLTDNGSVYTSRFTGGRNGFEYLLASLGIAQKNGHPGHPQTQGKIERFHQTLKRWLAAQPAAASVAELQNQLDTFTSIYNHIRAHRALDGTTPAQAYTATIKAAPASHTDNPHYRVRNDHIDRLGKISLRRAGRMHHLGVGAAHAGQAVTILIDAHTATVINQHTGEVLSEHTINPDSSYWRNQHKPAGRWPHQNMNDVATQM
jgi:transposase InsO family protein